MFTKGHYSCIVCSSIGLGLELKGKQTVIKTVSSPRLYHIFTNIGSSSTFGPLQMVSTFTYIRHHIDSLSTECLIRYLLRFLLLRSGETYLGVVHALPYLHRPTVIILRKKKKKKNVNLDPKNDHDFHVFTLMSSNTQYIDIILSLY